MGKFRNLWGKLKLLHPKNLAKEVHVYGYHFSWKSHVLWMISALMGISAVGILFQLQTVQFFVVVAAVILVLPVLVLDMYKKMYEQKRFADIASYMEQMLYSFQKNGKIASALKECRELFEEGQMRECIERVILHIELGKPQSEQGVLRECLSIVEEYYSCSKLGMVHNLLVNAEEYGGESDDSIVLALEDIERWKKRGYSLQAEKKKSHIDNIISIIVATLLCAVALYVLDAMKEMFSAHAQIDIFAIPLIQVSSAVFILILLHIYVKSARSLTDDWLAEVTLREPEYILKSYDMVTNYDEGHARRKSILLAIIPIIFASICFYMKMLVPEIVCLLLMVFFLLQHKIGYMLAKKDITEEMYLALPQWLFGMALLLQNNNVQVALTKSYEDAPYVLKPELEMLLIRLQQQPGKLRSYTEFCSSFDLPEVTSCMKLLHAFSENGTGNVDTQMKHLLERVGQMQDMADGIRNANIAFRMKMIFSYPVIAATVKLLLDLSLGMVVMMQILGGIGGV